MSKTRKIGVGVIIIDQNGDLLLHLRDHNTPLMTNQWSLVGGGIEPDENPEDAAKREVMEETSLVVSEVMKVGSISFSDDWDALIYQAKVNTLNNLMVLGEGKQLKFFSQDDLLILLDKLNYTNPFLDFLKKHIS